MHRRAIDNTLPKRKKYIEQILNPYLLYEILWLQTKRKIVISNNDIYVQYLKMYIQINITMRTNIKVPVLEKCNFLLLHTGVHTFTVGVVPLPP